MKLNKGQTERLTLLQEESAEVIQASSKIKRFGYDSYHPSQSGENRKTNRDSLEEEIGNLVISIMLLCAAGDVSEQRIDEAIKKKMQTLGKYTKYQKKTIEKVKENYLD